MHDPIELRAGLLSLGLVPAIGGSVAYFRAGTTDLMRPLSTEQAARRDVLGTAMFPMVPYANRIADNYFRFGGKVWHVAPNNPPERFNVHGTGWRLPWVPSDVRADEATLALELVAPGDPHIYRAQQHFVLTPERLRVTMTLTNCGTRPMPFGFGLHPWFKRDADVSVEFRAERFWLEGPDGVATEPVALSAHHDLTGGCPLPTTWRNNGYGGWDGKAAIRFPGSGFGLQITAEPVFKHLMFYADPAKPFFCLEPQTNAPCAFNREDQGDATLGIIVLDPGQSSAGSVSFTPFPL